jgi:hypothetical protein
MAKKVEIELDVKGNIVESTKNLRALKSELKNVAAGTAEWNKIKNDIRDIEDALESAGQSSEDFKGLLETAPGPLGMLGGAIKKVELATKSWGAALKATGIGLLVSLIGGLVAAFSQTEGSLKKLEPLLIGMEKIFGGLVEMAMPLVDMMLELGLKALPFVTDAFKNVYAAVFSVFQSLGKLGQAVMKLIKGDFAGAWDTAKESVTKFGENFTQNQKNFEKGAAKMTKTQKENADKQKEINDKALADKLKNMEAQDKIDEATMERMKAEALALATTEQQKLDIEEKFAKKSYELKKKDLEDKQKLYKKDTAEYKGYTADLIKLDAEYTSTKTANDEKQKQIELNKRKEFFQKDKAIYQSQVDERLRNRDTADEKELQALDLKLKKGEIKQYEYDVRLHQMRRDQLNNKMNDLNLAEQAELLHYKLLFDRKKINEDDYQAQILEITKKYGDKRLETVKLQGENEFTQAQKLAQMLIDTKQYEKDAIIELRNNYNQNILKQKPNFYSLNWLKKILRKN